MRRPPSEKPPRTDLSLLPLARDRHKGREAAGPSRETHHRPLPQHERGHLHELPPPPYPAREGGQQARIVAIPPRALLRETAVESDDGRLVHRRNADLRDLSLGRGDVGFVDVYVVWTT